MAEPGASRRIGARRTALALLLAVVIPVAACGKSSNDSSTSSEESTAVPDEPTTNTDAAHDRGGASGVIEVAGSGIAASDESLWVNGESSVSRIDANTGEVMGTADIPDGAWSVAVVGEEAWTLSSRSLDPVAIRVGVDYGIDATVPLPSTGAEIAAGASGVWITVADPGRLLRIDPETATITHEIPLVGESGETLSPGPLTVTDDRVWVATRGDGLVVGVDPTTASIVERFAVGAAHQVAAASDVLWVSEGPEGSITKLDATTGEVVGEIAQPAGTLWLDWVSATDTAVWAAIGANDQIVSIDPESLEVLEVLDIPASRVLVTDDGRVWATIPERSFGPD